MKTQRCEARTTVRAHDPRLLFDLFLRPECHPVISLLSCASFHQVRLELSPDSPSERYERQKGENSRAATPWCVSEPRTAATIIL